RVLHPTLELYSLRGTLCETPPGIRLVVLPPRRCRPPPITALRASRSENNEKLTDGRLGRTVSHVDRSRRPRPDTLHGSTGLRAGNDRDPFRLWLRAGRERRGGG